MDLPIDPAKFRVDPNPGFKLKNRTPDRPQELDKEAFAQTTEELLTHLGEMQEILHAQDTHRVLVVLQATDTGGKDGTIRRVFGALNPLGVNTVAFKAPTANEMAYDFLWRAHAGVPANGDITIFNRSHYEDVLIVRVHDLVPEKVWRRRYGHIRHFEKLLTDEGTTIVKLFLHISKDVQKERLQSRLDDPAKHWKFNPADLEEREYWDDYQLAYGDAIAQTSTNNAPWHVIPANSKWYRDLIIASIMVKTLESLNLAYPPPPEGLNTITID